MTAGLSSFLLLTAVSLLVQAALCIAAFAYGYVHGIDGEDLASGQPALACYRLGRWARRRRDARIRRRISGGRGR